MFEAQLLNDLKKEFNITTNKYNKSIKILIKQYIRGEISKQGLTDILVGFAKQDETPTAEGGGTNRPDFEKR